MNRISIKAKVSGTFGLVLAILVVLGGFSVYELAAVNRTSTDMAENWLPSVQSLGEINAAVSDFRAAEENHILQTDDAGMSAAETAMAKASDNLAKARAAYESLISAGEERALYKAFSDAWDGYKAVNRSVLELSRAGKNTEARDLVNGKSADLYEQAGGKVDALVALMPRVALPQAPMATRSIPSRAMPSSQ